MPGQASELAFKEVGRSQGHGATNLSSEAEDLLSKVAASRREFRNVNFVFGEGQSPKLRELREATMALNLGGANILRHDSPRIVYVAPLVAAPPRVLLGVDPLPAPPEGDDGVEAVAEHSAIALAGVTARSRPRWRPWQQLPSLVRACVPRVRAGRADGVVERGVQAMTANLRRPSRGDV